MIYLVYIVVGFTFIQLLVVVVNLFFKERLNDLNSTFNGLVSVLIPARNEELNIATILTDLQKQDYANIEILVFDDQSTDKTNFIVNQFIKQDNRIKLIESSGLPNGWLGKNHACHEMSKQAKGKYLLFLDADVRLNTNIIIHSIEKSERHKLGLLSIFPVQQMLTMGEKITVPNMNFILLSLLPLILVRKTKYRSLAAANGQFMLFESGTYQTISPHEKMKADKVEDIVIARYYKQLNIPVACLVGDETITCRMYHGFNDSVKGFSKNAIFFFGNSILLAFLFWFITTVGFVIVFLGTDTTTFILYLITLFIIRILISRMSKQEIFTNLLLLIPQQLTLGIIILKAAMSELKNDYQWKGRNIS